MDGSGRTLDYIACSLNSRLDYGWWYGGTFAVERNGGREFVIRYVPKRGQTIPDEWTHEVRHRQRRFRFSSHQSNPKNIRSAEWEKNGLCRVVVHDGRFHIT
jgi:hypothetical protein